MFRLPHNSRPLFIAIPLLQDFKFRRTSYKSPAKSFQLTGSRYAELELEEPRIWMDDIQLGLGLWQGFYQESDRVWLRWYDTNGDWVLIPEERERRRVERLAQQLRRLGVEPDLDEPI